MTWFYIMWIVGAISFVLSLYASLRVLNQIINLNTVRINENKKRIENFEKRLLGEDCDNS